MGGFFGVVSREDCVDDLFYGTDYHSHLGTMRGGMAVKCNGSYVRMIHDITSAQFRSKFEDDIEKMKGSRKGIGVISDKESQPLLIRSRLGDYAIATVGRINNREELAQKAMREWNAGFSEMSRKEINQTELAAILINQGVDFKDGIQLAQDSIEGSCSILLLTDEGMYAARDNLGRTPIAVGKKEGGYAATLETCAFPNLGFEAERHLGPGEIIRITEEGAEQLKRPGDKMQICSFLWVYYGFPASSYEGRNVELVRYRCGERLARGEDTEIDLVAGIPDSGTAHAIGFAQEREIPYQRPFVKYTPTWPRSFMPQDQEQRDLVARMKLIPIREIIEGQRLLFCEDSIVRGTQLRETIQRLYAYGAKEVHMRPACPPLIYGCKFLNFSTSRSELDLAARRAIREIEGLKEEEAKEMDGTALGEYAGGSERYQVMVEKIRGQLGLSTLRYQKLDDLVSAIGLPKEKLCTYCWDGAELK